ncbi:MAG: ammonia-forming cytochrome c nitrite reductase subunit c552 [bacterium]|nr:ammonia-forming cytochrome c nitrite reductase subunit c552 [bacterium]
MQIFKITLVGLMVVLGTNLVFADTCHECHQSKDLKVTDKKLYDYNLDFEISVHGIAELACTDCHGGDDSTTNLKKAHKGVMDPVRYDKIPGTCGECHDEQHEAFVASNHYKLLEKDGSAPNCVTCHGSMDMDFIFASRVKNTCQFCHNLESDTLPEVPDQADYILSKINIIKGYRGFVQTHASDRDQVQALDARFDQLTARWHSFDLDGVEADTRALLGDYRKAKAQAMKDRKKN